MNKKSQNLPEWYSEYKTFIENSINNYLINHFKNEENKGFDEFKEAVFYGIKGGKKIRSILALEFFLILSGKKFNEISENDDIIKLCIGIEFLHSYSLIHDDLPAIDNDELRRGKKTLWNEFGEDKGIFVGDFFNSLAFEVLSETNNNKIVKLFGEAVGIKGMIGGQVLDLFYEKNEEELNLKNLEEVHNKKTGELIKFSIIGGIILSGYKGDLEEFKNFGKNIGLAFQIKDDLLDVEGNFEDTGKSVGDGEDKGFVYFMGLEKSKKYLEEKISESTKIISNLNSEKLNFIVQYIGNRKK